MIQTVLGSARFAQQSDKHLAELRNMVTSPGGTSAEAIYQLGELGEQATTSKLAEWLDVAPPSVSVMVRRLGEQGLVHYEPYRPILLTADGCARALPVA